MAKGEESIREVSTRPHGGMQSLPTRRIRVIGVPLDMGASRRGVDMGPSAMRVAGLEARLEALRPALYAAALPVGAPSRVPGS